MAEGSVVVSGIRGAALRTAPGNIYLLAEDVTRMLREQHEYFERLIEARRGLALTEAQRLQFAAMNGASVLLQELQEALDLMCIEMATDAADMVEQEGKSG